jgi:hypothetical protein
MESILGPAGVACHGKAMERTRDVLRPQTIKQRHVLEPFKDYHDTL